MHAYINAHKYKRTCIQLCIQAQAQCIWCENKIKKILKRGYKEHPTRILEINCFSMLELYIHT